MPYRMSQAPIARLELGSARGFSLRIGLGLTLVGGAPVAFVGLLMSGVVLPQLFGLVVVGFVLILRARLATLEVDRGAREVRVTIRALRPRAHVTVPFDAIEGVRLVRTGPSKDADHAVAIVRADDEPLILARAGSASPALEGERAKVGDFLLEQGALAGLIRVAVPAVASAPLVASEEEPVEEIDARTGTR